MASVDADMMATAIGYIVTSLSHLFFCTLLALTYLMSSPHHGLHLEQHSLGYNAKRGGHPQLPARPVRSTGMGRGGYPRLR